MDWAAIIAGLVALAGAILGYLSKSREAKETGVLLDAQNSKIQALEEANGRKSKYIKVLERELVRRATPAELVLILNSLHPSNRRDPATVLPGVDSAVPNPDVGAVRE